MAHQRKTIRDAIVTAVTGLATTGANVYNTRPYPVDAGELPALVVMASDEERQDEEQVHVAATVAPVPTKRDLTVEILAVAAGSTYYDTLDQIALEVETALGVDLTLSGAVRELWYAGTELEMTNEVDQPAGVLTIRYIASYITDMRDPQASL